MVIEYMISWLSHSRMTRLSPNTRSNSGCMDSKSIRVSLTSKIRTLGLWAAHLSWSRRLGLVAMGTSSWGFEAPQDFVPGPAKGQFSLVIVMIRRGWNPRSAVEDGGVLRVAQRIGGHERAFGDDPQTARARGLEGGVGQSGAEALAV